MSLYDKYGRQITDLRISVTDRCNFRCVYCRSADPENYREHDEILSWAELERLAACPPAARALNIEKMKGLTQNWPAGDWESSEIVSRYRLALLRGISAGHFLRKTSGAN